MHARCPDLLLGKLLVKPPRLLGTKADHSGGVLELAPQPPGSPYLQDQTLLCNHERLSPILHDRSACVSLCRASAAPNTWQGGPVSQTAH